MKQSAPLSVSSATGADGRGRRGNIVPLKTKRAAGSQGRRSLAALERMKKRLSKSEEDPRREANLRVVLEHLPFPVVVHALLPGGRILLLNPKFVEVFGYTPEELGTVLDWARRAYPDETYRAEVSARWSAAVRRATKGNGVIEDHEFRVTAKDGSVHDVILNGTAVDHRLVVVIRDVTEKKKHYADRELLRRTVEKIAYEVTKHIPVGTFTIALAPGASLPTFSFMSDRFLEMTGVTMEEAQQDAGTVLARLHPEDRKAWLKHGAEMLAAKASFCGEARWQVEGGVRWITAEAVPRGLPDGTTVWEGVLIDITEQKDAEAKLRESQRQLADAKEHYRLLAENAADAVMRCDRSGRIEWVTPSVTGLTGWQPAQLTGFLCKDFVHPDDRDLLAAAQNNVMDGTLGQVELRFRTSQGGYHWVGLSLRPFFDEMRLVNGYVAGWRDVTNRYEAAWRLAQSEEHYRLLTRNAYGTVVRTDAEGTILWVSPTLEAVLGYRPEEWVGRRVGEIAEPDSARRVPDDLRKLARGESVVGRYRVKDKLGRCHWVESFASPYVDMDGQVNGVVSSFHIVDAQVAAENWSTRRAPTS